MQTTLLSVAIAIILALVTALVAPLFIDWTGRRLLFEQEATRLIGIDVQVKGPIDVRLLPAPSLTLHDIQIGEESGAVSARSLRMEFALGSLVRGEWRAAEVHLDGPKLAIALDSAGRIHPPRLSAGFNPDEFSIDRLSVQNGIVELSDAASGGSLKLTRVWFNGEARSLVGPFKGEGAATVAGQLYPFRISAGRLAEDGSIKLQVNVDPVDYPLSLQGSGSFVLTGGEPRFEGSFALSRPVGIAAQSIAGGSQVVTQPWQLNGKIKADPESALLQNVEFQFGSDGQGLHLTGVAAFNFGAQPRFDGVVSGRQMDLDRTMASVGADRRGPATAIRHLVELGSVAFRIPLPIHIGFGIDQVTLGGNTLQNVRGDIGSRADGWSLDQLEFRAPGATQIRMSGKLVVKPNAVAFTGPMDVDSSDPKTLAAWLEGREDVSQGLARPLNIRGDVTIASDRVIIDRMEGEFERKPVTGRVAYFFRSGDHPARLEGDLKAPQIDFDGAVNFGRTLFAGSRMEAPREISMTADLGRATLFGTELRDMQVRLELDSEGLMLKRLSVGDFGGGMLSASGRIEISANRPRGKVFIDLDAKQTGRLTAIAKRFLPDAAVSVVTPLERADHVQLHGSINIAGDETIGSADTESSTRRVAADVSVAGKFDSLHIDTRARIRGDWQKPSTAQLDLDGKIDSPDSDSLTRYLGLSTIISAGKGPAHLKVRIVGPVNGDMRVSSNLEADGVTAQIAGMAHLSAKGLIEGAGTLDVKEAELQPPRGGGETLPLKFSSQIARADGRVKLDNIAAKIGASDFRGRISLDDSSPGRLEGMLEADFLDWSRIGPYAIGIAQVTGPTAGWNWSREPFGPGAFGKVAGGLAIKIGRVQLFPNVPARSLAGDVRLESDEIRIDSLQGDIAGGRFTGAISFHKGDEGLNLRFKVSLQGADMATLLPPAPRPAITGSLNIELEAEGTGLSPVALVGSLKGSGTAELVDARLARLNPQTFGAVVQAVDQGLPIEAPRIADAVAKSLNTGHLSIKRAVSSLVMTAGQIRANETKAEAGEGALSISGALDLTDGSLDAKLVLSGNAEVAGARPDIFMSLRGPLQSPSRAIDVSALTGWLTLRAVENQTRRLQTIESGLPQSSDGAQGKGGGAPSLPPPIMINPAPKPRSAGQPAPSVRSQN